MIDALRAPGGARLVLLAGMAVLGAGLYLQAAAGPVLDPEGPALRALAAADIGRALAFQTDPDEARPLANLLVYLATAGSGTMASAAALWVARRRWRIWGSHLPVDALRAASMRVFVTPLIAEVTTATRCPRSSAEVTRLAA